MQKVDKSMCKMIHKMHQEIKYQQPFIFIYIKNFVFLPHLPFVAMFILKRKTKKKQQQNNIQ